MQTQRWVNQSQPQSLFNATILLYINAAFSLLNLVGGVAGLLTLAALAGVGGGYGIANEKKWGYYLAIAVAALPLSISILIVATSGLSFGLIIALLFQVLLVGLLLHPTSRSYQKIWFK